eukprot:s1718_g5.t1
MSHDFTSLELSLRSTRGLTTLQAAMGESHAFGASFLCGPSRRHLVMGVCVAMSILCAARVFRWLIILGSSVEVEQKVPSCVGEECFQVFTCKGLKDATAHVMEPLFTLSGLIFFPMGFHAAHHGDDLQMKRFGLFLLGMTILRIAVIGCDMLFLHNCQMVQWTLAVEDFASAFRGTWRGSGAECPTWQTFQAELLAALRAPGLGHTLQRWRPAVLRKALRSTEALSQAGHVESREVLEQIARAADLGTLGDMEIGIHMG